MNVRFVIAIALATAACKNAETKPAGAAPLEHKIADGKGAETYARFCAPCHGEDATGYKADHAPSLVNPTFLESATDSFLIDAIEQGRPGTSMAAYSQRFGGPLDGIAINGLVGWIRSHGPTPQRLAPVAAGDPAHGGAIYADKCQACHGTPDVRGEFVSLSNARFLATASDAFLAHAIENGRPGTKMPAWHGVLPEQDIADVIAFVRSRQQSVDVQRLAAPTGTEPLFVNPTGAAPHFVGHVEQCPPGQAGCKSDPRYVPAADVKRALDEHERFVIIDARSASEWMTVHITGAVSIPYSDMKRLDEIPKDAWIVAYCACPHHLSGIVVDELQKRGYPHAFVIDEGINFWQRQGYPIVAAPGAPMPPAEPR